jgi:hypothetical protein
MRRITDLRLKAEQGVEMDDCVERPPLAISWRQDPVWSRLLTRHGHTAMAFKAAAGRCLEWQGADNGKGYGMSGSPVHRKIWERFFGPIPRGWVVHHVCGNRRCASPEHLVALPRRHHSRLEQDFSAIHGDRGRGRKLTSATVVWIRSEIARGRGDADIARETRVGRSMVNHIRHRRRWRGVGALI